MTDLRAINMLEAEMKDRLEAKDKELAALRERVANLVADRDTLASWAKKEEVRAETAERDASELASQNTNMRNDLVLMGMARDTAERERDHFKSKAHEYFGWYDEALRERDEAREALKAVEPYLDAITCYASTTKEHEGNRFAQLVRAAAITGEKP